MRCILMRNMEQIHDFAVKWGDKFKDQDICYRELVGHYLADDCKLLGFKMDCGHAFSKKYGSAVYNSDALAKIINDITDIPLLGSAIYSRWRFFSYWSYDPASILDNENRQWFILALNRLALLSEDN